MPANSIRKILKRAFDKIRNERFKNNLLQAIPFWVASLITGLIAVFYSKIFAFLEGETFIIIHPHAWIIFILTPVCFFVSWWVVQQFASNARGSGIPQVMAAIELANPKYDKKVTKLLSIKVFIIKIISSFAMILGGGLIGKEGPTIQLAGTVFRKINEWLPSWWPKISKRNMIMTGAAAGLAAAFNTPLGGIVFAVEELTKTHISYFKTALFTAVIIAGLTAQGLLGPYLYLGYPDVTNLAKFIFLPIILVAIVSGVAGSAMSKIILFIFRWKRKFKFQYQHILFVLSCAMIIASVAYFFDERILGSGKEIMNSILFTSTNNVAWYTVIDRIGGTILSFTTGAAGGVFAPSLGAGAGIGAVMAKWFEVSSTNAHLLVLCGMVGFNLWHFYIILFYTLAGAPNRRRLMEPCGKYVL